MKLKRIGFAPQDRHGINLIWRASAVKPFVEKWAEKNLQKPWKVIPVYEKLPSKKPKPREHGPFLSDGGDSPYCSRCHYYQWNIK